MALKFKHYGVTFGRGRRQRQGVRVQSPDPQPGEFHLDEANGVFTFAAADVAKRASLQIHATYDLPNRKARRGA